MDYVKNPVVGHFEHQTLSEILNSSLYKNVLEKVRGNVESSEDFICKKCERAIV